jgi:hypothetical protein
LGKKRIKPFLYRVVLRTLALRVIKIKVDGGTTLKVGNENMGEMLKRGVGGSSHIPLLLVIRHHVPRRKIKKVDFP